jgi:protease-4
MVDDLHDQFVRAVAKGRDMELDLVRSLADGRAYTGRQAKELGLVDGLGPMQQALEVLQHQARIGDDYQLLEGPKRETSILGWVLNALGLEAKAWTTGQPRWEFRYEYRP